MSTIQKIFAVLPFAFISMVAHAQSAETPSAFNYKATVYVYLPSVGGQTTFPASGGGSGISVSGEQILDSLEFAFMGSLDAHNGDWGVFTDLIYLDLQADKSDSRDFSLSGPGGRINLPASTSADLGFGLKGLVWTIAGQKRIVSQPGLNVDLLAGTRMFKINNTADWDITGNVGPWSGARTGSAEIRKTIWDGVVGFKGRAALGQSERWSMPFYFDIGTGESDLTVQAAAGLSYAFSWGEATAMWRYVGYEFSSGSAIQDVNFNGPMLGAMFKF